MARWRLTGPWRKAVGGAIIGALFGGLFAVIAMEYGFWFTLGTFAFAITFTALFVVATWLMFED